MAASSQGPAVAVVGAGPWGRNLVRNFRDLRALATVCDVDTAALARAREADPGLRVTTDYREVLRDPAIGAVALATPAALHAEMARDALIAGKDVFVEKPLALTVEDGASVVALARELGRILMIGHLLWYHPAIVRLKELVDAGELGELRYLYSHRLNLGKFRQEESILWSFAPHDVSVILGLVGAMPERVHAEGGSWLHRDVADVTTTNLVFPGGVRAHVFVSWLHPYKDQRLVVVGTKKMAVFDDLAPEEKLVLYPHDIEWKDAVPVPARRERVTVPVGSEEPLRVECEHFLRCITERSEPRTGGDEALRVLSVLRDSERALGGVRDDGVHPTATIDPGVEIGEGTRVWHHAHVMSGARIGRECRLGQNVFVGRDVRIGDGVKVQNNVSVFEGVTLEDHVFCGPSVVFTNVTHPRSEIERKDEFRPTRVCRGATLGANATILCGTTIGEYAFVGAGAVVSRDVPDYGLVTGVPARLAGWMCRCGNRLSAAGRRHACPACGREYHLEGDRLAPASRAVR